MFLNNKCYFVRPKLGLFHLYTIVSFALVILYTSTQAQSTDSLQAIINSSSNASVKVKNYKKLASTLAANGKGKEAILVYNKTLELEKNKPDSTAAIYNEIGNVQSDLGENLNALQSYQQALGSLKDNNIALQAKINKNIGALYLSWKKLNLALQYYNAAEKLAVEAGDKRTVADLSNNKGTVYEQQNKFTLAFEAYTSAQNFYLQQKINDRICLTYNNLAILSKVTKNLNKSAAYYKKSVEYAALANNKWLTAAIGNNLGNLLSEMGSYAESSRYLNNALKLEQEIEARELIPETYENLAKNAHRQGSYQLAYNYHIKFSEAQNQFINLENTKEVSKLEQQFEAVSKKKRIELLNKEYKIQQLTLTQRNTTLSIIIFLFMAVATIVFLAFSKYRLKQNSQMQLIKIQSNSKLQEEKLRISRELHDNIGSQLGFINNAIQHIYNKNSSDSDVLEIQTVTQNTIRELRSTVWLINQQQFTLDEFIIKLREYVKPYRTGITLITIDQLGEHDCILEPAIATNLFRIMQEAINNAIKYADSKHITVHFSYSLNILLMQIADDGKGYDTLLKQQGYGLKNMQARVSNIQGTCTIKSTKNEGTQIFVSIPVKGYTLAEY